MLFQPCGQIVCGPIRQQIGNPVPLQVYENGAVSLPPTPRPVIDSQMPDRVGLFPVLVDILGGTQNCVVAELYRESFQNAPTGKTASM